MVRILPRLQTRSGSYHGLGIAVNRSVNEIIHKKHVQEKGEELSEQRLRKRRNHNIEERKAFQRDDGHNCQMS